MARYRCSKCPDVTMLMPKHDFCYSCFKKNFKEILPTLSAWECRDIIDVLEDVLETQAGYVDMINDLRRRITELGAEIPQKREGTPIPMVSTTLLLR